MKKYIAIFLCLVGLVMAQGYTEWQQGASEGLKIGFKLGVAYEQAQKGINIEGFNAQVDTYNAWVREHFGEDLSLLMQKMTGPIDLQKPVLLENNTTAPKGIVHKIDGNTLPEGTYTTNDMNLLPESITNTGSFEGEYLGGV